MKKLDRDKDGRGGGGDRAVREAAPRGREAAPGGESDRDTRPGRLIS